MEKETETEKREAVCEYYKDCVGYGVSCPHCKYLIPVKEGGE